MSHGGRRGQSVCTHLFGGSLGGLGRGRSAWSTAWRGSGTAYHVLKMSESVRTVACLLSCLVVAIGAQQGLAGECGWGAWEGTVQLHQARVRTLPQTGQASALYPDTASADRCPLHTAPIISVLWSPARAALHPVFPLCCPAYYSPKPLVLTVSTSAVGNQNRFWPLPSRIVLVCHCLHSVDSLVHSSRSHPG